MRICLYTDTALPKVGEQELVIDALARQFLALGHEPVVLAPRPRKLWTNDEAFPYPVVRHPRFFSTRFFVSWYRWFLERQYRQRPFDVLHCHGVYPPSYLAALAQPRIPVPVVVTSHGGDVYEQNVRLKKPAIGARCAKGLANAAALVAISRVTREGLTRLCPQAAPRIVDIPNGVQLANFSKAVARPADMDPTVEPGRYAIFLGQLKHRKGVDVLLQALARTPTKGKVQLVIVGDGEERAFLEVLCDQLDLRERMRFLSAVTGPGKAWLLQNARFAVVPSRQWEAFSMVVLENFACALPTLATNVPGLADMIQPERTGLLVPSESPEDMAAALTRLYDDDALVQRMSRWTREVVRAYDWSKIAAKHLDLYERLLGNSQAIAA